MMILIDGAVAGRRRGSTRRPTRSAPRKSRVFFTVTLPGAKYGLISAGFVVFTLVITDFGIAKVIGGHFNVLATDVYKQVDRPAELRDGRGGRLRAADAGRARLRRRPASSSAGRWRCCRRAPCRWSPSRTRGATGRCSRLLRRRRRTDPRASSAMAVWASFVTYWPYNLSLTLKNYDFGDFEPNGWAPYFNSLMMAALDGGDRHRRRLHRRLPDREDARLRAGRAASPSSWRCCRWRCRAGARPRLHLLLQRARGTRSTFSTARWRSWSVNSIAHFYTVRAPHRRRPR